MQLFCIKNYTREYILYSKSRGLECNELLRYSFYQAYLAQSSDLEAILRKDVSEWKIEVPFEDWLHTNTDSNPVATVSVIEQLPRLLERYRNAAVDKAMQSPAVAKAKILGQMPKKLVEPPLTRVEFVEQSERAVQILVEFLVLISKNEIYDDVMYGFYEDFYFQDPKIQSSLHTILSLLSRVT